MKLTRKSSLVVFGMALGLGAVAASAQVTASSHTVITSSLGSATGLAVDQLGNLYAADGTNNVLLQLQGSNAAPASVITGLSAPQQVAFDISRNIYIANGTSKTVLEIPYQGGTLNLNATRTLGTGLGTVVGVATDLSGNIYAVDATNKQVVKISGTTQTTILTGLSAPRQIAVDRLGDVYVADSGANAVVYLPAGGTIPSTIGTGFNAPVGVATDPGNNLYVADTGNGQIVEIPYVGGAASQTTVLTGLSAPGSLATDTRGSVYIASGGSIVRYGGGSSVYFGLLPVGASSQTFPITLNFASAVSPATIKVVTTGITGLDYKDAGGDSCAAGGTYSAGTTCTVNVTFTPRTVGPRYGAIVLYASNNQVLARIFLGGGGLGALITSDPGVLNTVAPSVTGGGNYTTVTTPRGITVDAGGNIFLAEFGYTAASGTITGPNRISELQSSVISSYSITSAGVATFTGNNSFVAGQVVTLVGFPRSTLFNSTTITILASGLSNSQFQANVPSAAAAYDGASAIEPGVAYGTAAVVANTGTNDVAINGAGDLIVASGSTAVNEIPNENGTLNFADIFALGTGYSKARVARVDVGGNVFWCDNGTNSTYELAAGATSVVALGTNKYTTGCLGVSVDLYGNLVVGDSGNGKVLYVPASGQTPYETGSGFTSEWGVAFDPSGSVWVTSSGAAVLGRIPNENGTLVGADQILSTVGNVKDFDLWVDGSGTLYTTQDSGNVVSAFSIINRSASNQTFTKSTAIGATNATVLTDIVSNSGNLPPVFTNGGTIGLNDVNDFPFATSASPACNFTLGLTQGFTCNLAFNFIPASSGTRTETLEVTSNALLNPQIYLTGTATGTAAGTTSLTLAQTAPTGTTSPGQAVTISIKAATTGTATPTGAVTYYIDGKPTLSGQLSSGAQTYNITAGLTLGTHTIGATYAGDANYAPITTPATTTVTVVLATSTVSLISSGNEVAVNQSAVFTATIPTLSGLAVPTGSVVFTDTSNSTTVGTGTVNSQGVASVSTTTLALGTHTILAAYSGDGVYAGSKSTTVTVIVGNFTTTTTVLTLAPNSSSYTYGQAVAASVVVAPTSGSGTPTGSASFTLDGSPTVVTLVNGKASLNLASIPAGSHTFVVYYSGDSTYASSASTTALFTVVKAVTATTLSTSSTAALASVPITLTAAVSSSTSVPTGTVSFNIGQFVVGTAPVVNGVATLVTTLLPAGADNIVAAYSGDNNDSSSSSTAITVTITLVQSTLNISAAPSVILSGSTTTLTASLTAPVTAAFAGTITFFQGSTSLGTATVSGSGIATIATPALTASTNSFSATYSGSAVFTSSATTTPALVYVTNASGAGMVATASLGTGLSSVSGVAVDLTGNVYIDDKTKGQIDIVAGGAGAQSVAIPSLTATGSLATDIQGDLFVANGTANHVTEYPSSGGALVLSSAKQFGNGLGAINSVAVDAAGNIYMTDATNKQVIKYSTGGIQSVLPMTVTNPQQIAADASGNIYVADGTSNHLVFLSGTGVTANVGSGLSNPTGVAVDSNGNIYVSDTGNNRVVKIPLVGGVPSTGGQSVLIPTITAPGQIAIDRHLALYIGQATSVFKWQAGQASFGALSPGVSSPLYTLTFTFQSAVTPSTINVLTGGVAGGEYKAAEGTTCVAGTAYAAGTSCAVTVRFTPAYAGVRPGAVTFATSVGQPLITAYLGGVGLAAQLAFDSTITPTTLTAVSPASASLGGTANGNALRGFATDPNGNIYVCDYNNSRVIETNAAGTLASVLYAGTGCASVAIDGAGNVLVDNGANVILLPNENGTVNGNDAYVVASGFAGSRGMSADGFGNLYVADSTNLRVVIAPIAQPSLGLTVVPFTGLLSAYDAAVDWLGNVAVVDSSAGGVVYLPSNGTAQSTIGPKLCAPYALAMDPAGTVYVTEISVASTVTTCIGNPTPGDDVVRISPTSPGSYSEPVSHAVTPEAIYIDPRGNLYTGSGATIETVVRSALSLAFPGTPLGTTSSPLTTTLSNSGNATATFTSPSGLFYLDSADFATTTTGSNSCAGGASFFPGYSCNLTFTFTPVEAAARTADYAPISNSAVAPLLVLTGTGTGTGNYTTPTLGLAVTNPKSGTGTPNQSITLTATLGGTGCSGTLSLQIDGVFVGVQPASASAAFTVANGVSAGFHTGLATYSGDGTCGPATASLLFSAAGATPSTTALTLSATTLIQNPNTFVTPNLVFTVKVTGASGGAIPTGQVLFLDGTTQLGIAPVNATGSATFSTTALPIGTHSITANYAGDATYGTSSSVAQVVTVIYPGDYSLAIAPTPLTVTIGTVGTVTLTVTPNPTALGGPYPGTVVFTCTGLPVYATCTLSPSALQFDGTGTALTSNISIVTQSSFAELATPASAIRYAILPGGALFLLLTAAGLRRRRKLLRSSALTLSILLALGVLLANITACGSHAALATPAGTYTVTISGIGSGNINHSITLPVTIKSK